MLACVYLNLELGVFGGLVTPVCSYILSESIAQLLRFAFALLLLQEAELTRKEAELTRKEAEVTRAEVTIRREQQQIQEMRQRVSLVCGVVCCD